MTITPFFAVAISRGVAARPLLTKPDERTKSKIRRNTQSCLIAQSRPDADETR